MKKSLWNKALIVGLSPFLVHCAATGQQMSNVELRLRSMDTRLVTMERNISALDNQKRSQADIGATVDRLDAEILQIKGHLEENTRHLGSIESQGKARDQQLDANIAQRQEKASAQLRDELEAKLATLQQNLTRLTSQIDTTLAEIEAIKEVRAKEATERAMAAARTAREAEAAATAKKAAADTGSTREITPSQIKKRVTDTKEPQAAATAAAPDTKGKDSLYDQALKLFRDKKYKEAYSSFQTYIEKNPKADTVPNARFWVGDCLFNQGEYELAILEYQKVIADYPKHDKAPAALLKQGLAFEKLKDADTAKLVYQKLIEDYPKSDQADTAAKWLKGH